jgi:hypothetical protein
VVVAIAGCNRGSNQAASPSAGPDSSAVAGGSFVASSPLAGSRGDPLVSDSGTTSGSPDASASSTAAATPDAVASELDAIQQLIDDINNSLSSSDQSEQGGE